MNAFREISLRRTTIPRGLPTGTTFGPCKVNRPDGNGNETLDHLLIPGFGAPG